MSPDKPPLCRLINPERVAQRVGDGGLVGRSVACANQIKPGDSGPDA